MLTIMCSTEQGQKEIIEILPVDKLSTLILESKAEEESCLFMILLFAKLISVIENIELNSITNVFRQSMNSIKLHVGQFALKTDICIEALAYLSLKE